MPRDARRDRNDTLPAPPTPKLLPMMGRACRLRCCVCGSGNVFRHWTNMVERCPRCGFLFERSEGQFIGAVGMNTVLTFGLLLITLVGGLVLTSPNTPAVPMTLVSVAIAIVAPIVLYPFSKTTWTAIDLAMTPLEPGEAPWLTTPPPTSP